MKDINSMSQFKITEDKSKLLTLVTFLLQVMLWIFFNIQTMLKYFKKRNKKLLYF